MSHRLLWRIPARDIARRRSFSVSLHDSDADVARDSELESFNRSRGVVETVIRGATEAFVYGLAPENPLCQEHADILTRERGKHRLDLGQDVITGHETLYTEYRRVADFPRRGSIVFVLPYDRALFTRLLSACHDPANIMNPGSTHTKSALAFAKKQTASGQTACVLIPASVGGLSWLEIVSGPAQVTTLFKIAVSKCRFSEYG